MTASREQQVLLDRVREQETVIRRLWHRYTEDVGREPEVSDLTCIGGGDKRLIVPARSEVIRRVLDKGQSFEDAVNEFEFEWSHCHSEASTQRMASNRLMHSKRPLVVGRRTGDIVLRGFWGRGVSMPAFERLIQKVKSIQHGSLRRVDLADNGLNGNFVPGLVEILKRGVRQLDLSTNSFESPAMQQLCSVLPNVAPYIEALDVRFNPCSDDAGFVFCIANVVQELKFISRFAISVRAQPGGLEAVAAVPNQQDAPSAVRRPGSGRRPSVGAGHASVPKAASPTHLRSQSTSRGGPAAAIAQRGRHVASDLNPRRVRSQSSGRMGRIGRSADGGHGRVSGDGHAPGTASGVESAGVLGPVTPATVMLGSQDAAVAFFRGLSQCANLQALDLRSSSLGPAAAKRLAHLVRADRLVVLGLADCFLGDVVEPILDAVGACRRLVSLNLRLNSIGGHAGIELCRALDASVSLTEVDLASNDLGDDFGEAFARVLASNEVLWKVDLFRNPLGVRTGDALLNTLRRRNSSLVTIGDTVNGFFGLGMENRFKIQRHLDANLRGYDLVPPVEQTMDPSLEGFEWKILQDEPALFEPLLFLA